MEMFAWLEIAPIVAVLRFITRDNGVLLAITDGVRTSLQQSANSWGTPEF